VTWSLAAKKTRIREEDVKRKRKTRRRTWWPSELADLSLFWKRPEKAACDRQEKDPPLHKKAVP
jgi:hypothetical protein